MTQSTASLSSPRRDFQDMVAKSSGLTYQTIYGHSTSLGQKVRASLARGNYSTAVDPATAACAEKLPWWQQHHWHWQQQHRQRHYNMPD